MYACIHVCMQLFIYLFYWALGGSWISRFHCIWVKSVSWHKGTRNPCSPFVKPWEKESLYSKVTSCFHTQGNLGYQVFKLKADGLIPGLYFEPSSSLNRHYYSCVITPSLLLYRPFGRRKAFLGKYWLDHPLAVPSLSPLMPPAPVEMPPWWASWLERGLLAGPPRR